MTLTEKVLIETFQHPTQGGDYKSQLPGHPHPIYWDYRTAEGCSCNCRERASFILVDNHKRVSLMPSLDVTAFFEKLEAWGVDDTASEQGDVA